MNNVKCICEPTKGKFTINKEYEVRSWSADLFYLYDDENRMSLGGIPKVYFQYDENKFGTSD